MSLAVAAPTITSTDQTQKNEIVYGTLAIGASPLTYATGGAVLSFSGKDSVKSSSVPVEVTIASSPAAGTSPSGYVYQYCPGTTRDNGKVAIFQDAGSAAPLAELSAASTPAGVSGDTIVFKAVFPRI